ncbi:PREDICTED: early nodulin-75-like [Nicotiana attenuata]|uniref:early nodulin-75-like n=1 Tax=Nicotiana attenuata TaxID=49451 RepID=UPI000904F73A|nr:PREDICTED: early nodulin-75-like [Nicotiana attenuata]
MTSKDMDTRVVDPSREFVESESKLKGEVQMLKRQMAEKYQSWIRGHPPPSCPTNYTEKPATIPPLSPIQIPSAADISPEPFHTLPAKTTSYPAPLATHALVAPPPATFPRSSNETVLKVPDAQHYAPEPTFKVSDPYSHTPHFEPPEIVPDRISLAKMEKKPNESFREYELRWREQAARVNPPMEEKEMVEYILQAQKPTYFGHLITVVGSRHGPTNPPHQYTQPQPQPQTYPRAPHHPPQYYPPNNVRSSVQPPSRSLWRAPAPHNALLPSQHF